MARTASKPDWSDRKAPGREPEGSGEWDALRAELATLIDQVETRLMTHAEPAAPKRTPRKAAKQAAAAPQPEPRERNEKAMRSVREALDKVSERQGGQTILTRSDEIAEAIGQIRARQGIRPALSRRDARPVGERYDRRFDAEFETDSRGGGYGRADYGQPAPAAADPAMLIDLRRTLLDMGARIENFEARFTAQIADMGSNREVAGQVAQLADVVELLAGAVGDNGQVRSLEGQIAQLAQAVAHAPASEDSAILDRLDVLSRSLETLSSAQDAIGARQEADATRTEDTMRFVEESIRTIYDRIDAIDTSRVGAPAELERLIGDLAALSQALDARESQAQEVLTERFTALEDRIDALGMAERSGSDALKDSIASLRTAVLDTVEPRFGTIEDKLDLIVAQTTAPAMDPAEIEAQLKHITQRIEDTGTQIEGLLALARAASEEGDAAPDLDALADMVAERTRAQMPMAPSASKLDSADLDTLEARLSKLFSESRPTQEGQEAGSFDKLGDTIASVDTRLARLEATLNAQKPAMPVMRQARPPIDETMALSAAPAVTPAEAAPTPALAATAAADDFGSPRDAMPQSPDTDEPLRVRASAAGAMPIPDPQAIAREARTSAESAAALPQPFRLDPEAIARPEKPVSSLDLDAGTGFAAAPTVAARSEAKSEVQADPSNHTDDLHGAVNRANFIEAARRAARNQAEPDEAEPRSLIGRALARFQATEAEAAPGAVPALAPTLDPVETGKPGKISRRQAKKDQKAQAKADAAEARAAAAAAALSPATETPAGASAIDARSESFLRRHRRPLLLSTALVVVVLLTANLVSQRLMAGPDATNAATPAATQTVSPEVTTPEAVDAAPEIVETQPVAAEPMEADPVAAPAPTPRQQPQDIPPLREGAGPATSGALTAPAPAEGLSPALAAYVPSGAAALDQDLADSVDPVTTASIGDAAIDPITNSGASAPSVATMAIAEIPAGIGPDALRGAAEGGDAFAQFEIAAILTEGHVVEQDLTQAAAWYERSAVQGFAPAQYRLGNLYESGQGVDADLEQARLWYQQAAELGNRMSMHNLASLYAGGQLETQDFAAAAHWFEEAASRGLTDSQFNLGMLYARGLGVEQSFEDSYFWFSLAANSGDEDAVQARDDVARSLETDAMRQLDIQIATWTPVAIDMPANFAPIGTWTDDFATGAPIANQDVVQRVQELLAKLGYEVGTPDGLPGPLTREAIASFERATGMSETGEVNPRLLAVLGSQPV